MSIKLVTKREKIICTLIFLIAAILCSLYAYIRFFTNVNVSLVVIRQKGKIIRALPLETDAEFIVKSELGQNTIKIKNKKVCVTHADCPDMICAKTMPLTKDNALTSVIVCLPHRLIISLEQKR